MLSLPNWELQHICRKTTNKCEDACMLFTENIILLYLLFHVGSIQVTWDTFNLMPEFPALWWVVGYTQVEKQKEQHFLYNKAQKACAEPVRLKFICILDCFLRWCHWYPAIILRLLWRVVKAWEKLFSGKDQEGVITKEQVVVLSKRASCVPALHHSNPRALCCCADVTLIMLIVNCLCLSLAPSCQSSICRDEQKSH